MDAEKHSWLDNPRNVDKLAYALYAVCALLVLADLLYHKHVHFEFEHWFGFFALFSLVACVGLVLVARLLRVAVRRGEDYYDE